MSGDNIAHIVEVICGTIAFCSVMWMIVKY